MKTVGMLERRPLNKWVNRPPAPVDAVPLKSAIVVADDAWKTCRLSADAIGYFRCGCNDVQHTVQDMFLLSSVQKDPKGWSVTPDNFKESVVVFAVRKAVKHTWLNDRDQFTAPIGVGL